MVLRRISGSTKDEVTGEWRKLRNKALYYLYSQFFSDNQIKNDMGGAYNIYWGGDKIEMYAGFL
jgi:hypothetical protein